MRKPDAIPVAAALVLLCASGCHHYSRTSSLNTTWVDFNIYGRPAVFFDSKHHLPAAPQHARYYLWRHGPVNSWMTAAATTPEWPTELPAAGVYTPQQEPLPLVPELPLEEAPVPRGFTPPPVNIEIPSELQPPFSSQLPPPLPAPRENDSTNGWKERRVTPEQNPLPPASLPRLDGPTAVAPPTSPSAVQPAGWSSGVSQWSPSTTPPLTQQTSQLPQSPQLPQSNRLFARP